MFRIFLTAYVSLVMLAGSSVCCCTTRGVAGCFAGDEAGTPAEVQSSCCGHHAARDDAGADSAAGSDKSGDPSAPGEKHECPCHKNRSHFVSETRDQVVDVQQVRSIVPAPLEVALTVSTDVAVIVVDEHAQVPNRASHFGSAAEFLRALRTYLI